MPVLQDGELIVTALKNIHPDPPITEQEAQSASQLAPALREIGRNWIPILVLERQLNDYLLVEGRVIYEACRQAEFKRAHCIQVDRAAVGLTEHLQSLEPAADGSSQTVDILPLQKRVETIEQTLSRLEVSITQTIQYLLPAQEELAINVEDQQSLLAKLPWVSGLGEKYASEVVEDIMKYRPFASELELRREVRHIGFIFTGLKQQFKLSFRLS